MIALKHSFVIAGIAVIAAFFAFTTQVSAQETVTFSAPSSMVEMEIGDTYELTASIPGASEGSVQGMYTASVGPHNFNQLDFNMQGVSTAVVNVNQSTLDACISGLGWIRISQQAVVYSPFFASPREVQHIPCSVLISPVLTMPAQSPGVDCNDDTISNPAQPVGVDPVPVDTGWVNGERTLTYVPSAGYAFSSDTQTSFTFYDDDPCIVTPEPPAHTEVCGTNNDSVSIPNQPAGVLVSSDGGWSDNGIWAVNFSAAPGYVLSPDSQTNYVFEDTGPCITEMPIPPEHTEICGLDNDLVYVPDQPYGVIIIADGGWSEGIFRVTFTDAEHYLLPAGVQTEYVFEDAGPCGNDAPIPPAHTEICGTDNDLVILEDQPANVLVTSDGEWINGSWTITFSAEEHYELPAGVQTEYVFEDAGPCETDAPIPPVHTEICGTDNDLVTLEDQPANVLVTSDGEWINGSWTITFSAEEHYVLPASVQTEYVFVDAGPCIVTPNWPADPVEVCGPNNDIITIPTQPEGVTIVDSGWENGQRAIAFAPAEHYAFPPDTPNGMLATDENTPCETEPDGITVVVSLLTSDGGSIEGAPYALYAPVASQAVQQPYLEGAVGAGNQIVFTDLVAGDYRLVISPEGYEPVDRIVTVPEAEDAIEIEVPVMAIQQPEPSPIPSPTIEPTVEPTIEPTVEPTIEPTVEPSATATVDPTATSEPEPTPGVAVTELPKTGTGPSGGPLALIAVSLMAAAMAAIFAVRRLEAS